MAADRWIGRAQRWAGAVVLTAALAGCGSSTELSQRVEVPSSEYVSLSEEDEARVSEALSIARDDSYEAPERAAAYLLVSNANLLLWDQLQSKIDELDETQNDEFQTMTQAGRIYFMQAHRARARSWALRGVSVDDGAVKTRERVYEKRFAEAWELHQNESAAYEAMVKLLRQVIETRDNEHVPVEFMSDLRYSTAIFYTLLDKPASDMALAMEICGNNESEALRFAGDVAFLYDELAAKPTDAADAYRAIAASKPQTAEGYEAQVAVLDSLEKRQKIGAMEIGSADAFDSSSEGLALFRTVNEDLDVLVEMSGHKDKWKEEGSSSTEARAEELVRSFTIRMHGLAQQQDDASIYELAIDAYASYHALFPASGMRYEMLYFHAEALFKLGRYRDAYALYKEALGTEPHGEYRETILRSLVLTAYEACKGTPLPRVAAEQRTEMPEVHRDFISSGEQFISILEEDDPEFAGYIRYEIIRRHYLYGEVRVAEPLVEHFVRYMSDHEKAPQAAVVWLDLLARDATSGTDRDLRALERAAERIRSTSVLAGNDVVQRKLTQVYATDPPSFDGQVPE